MVKQARIEYKERCLMSDAQSAPYNPLAIRSIAESVVRELLGRPCGPLPPAARFSGAGIYAIYYHGDFADYALIARRNQQECAMPIYVGKAVPKGGRKGVRVDTGSNGFSLFNRLSQHGESIHAATNL